MTQDIDMRQGGADRVTNNGTVGSYIYGGIGGCSTITNSGTGTVNGSIYSSHNVDDQDYTANSIGAELQYQF